MSKRNRKYAAMELRTTAVLSTVLACALMGFISTGARAEAACPNEALRTGLSENLPDCRAYEMVTPVYKGGVSLEDVKAISGDGSHVIGEALGAFAGTESESYSNTEYELSRTTSGWVPSALDPPASASPESTFFGASSDLTRTLWGLHEPSQSIYEENLFVREPDGRFVEIGPLVPPSRGGGPPSGTTTTFGRGPLIFTHLVGASSDLSDVFVSIHGSSGLDLTWPGDATLEQNATSSLYEYVGTGLARPELVGVNNEDRQISDCGTELGGIALTLNDQNVGEKYNAVSSDGKTVFFTASHTSGETSVVCSPAGANKGPEVNELYARLNRVETVPISEPSADQCGRCQTGRSATTTAEKPAEFQGASESGATAFFTTEQELLPGQTTENLYEYDFNDPPGEKVVLVSQGSPSPEVQGVARVSEDGSHVYFVAKGVLTASPNREDHSPTLGGDNLYVYERDARFPGGHTAFVATLSGEDAADWREEDTRPVQATPDGRFLVFESDRDLTSDDTSTVDQVFEYDAAEETLVRVSVGQCSSPANPCASDERFNNDGNTTIDAARIREPGYYLTDSPTEAESSLSVSEDGQYVFFESAGELTEGAKIAAEAGAESIYEYRSEGSIANGNVYLISDGRDITGQPGVFREGHEVKGSRFVGEDVSGSDAFFSAGDPLLSTDTNAAADVYDARIDGGFPQSVGPAECSGEACQAGSPSFVVSASLSETVGSSTVAGGGNRTPSAGAKSPVGPSRQKLKVEPLTQRQKLSKALKACLHKPKKERPACEKQARRAYRSTRKAPKSRNGGKS